MRCTADAEKNSCRERYLVSAHQASKRIIFHLAFISDSVLLATLFPYAWFACFMVYFIMSICFTVCFLLLGRSRARRHLYVNFLRDVFVLSP